MCQNPLPYRQFELRGPHTNFERCRYIEPWISIKEASRAKVTPHNEGRVAEFQPLQSRQSGSQPEVQVHSTMAAISESSVAVAATPSLAEAAETGVDLDRRGVHAALLSPLRARELVERGLAELDDRRVVDRDHVHWGLVAILQLPARAALGRAVDCAGKASQCLERCTSRRVEARDGTYRHRGSRHRRPQRAGRRA